MPNIKTEGLTGDVRLRPYKVYTALLTQNGTDAPTVVVLENTTGAIVTTVRNDVGNYTLLFSIDPFGDGLKTTKIQDYLIPEDLNQTKGFLKGGYNDVGEYFLLTANDFSINSDNLLNKKLIEIRVYN